MAVRKQKSGAKRKPQVHPAHYMHQYDSLGRWASYWYQIHEIIDKKPESVLEIGIGNKTVLNYLRQQNIEVTGVDIDARLKPDVVADVTDLSVFQSDSFDVVACCEVLEHLPFDNFDRTLKEIHRVAKKWVVISLPHFGPFFTFSFHLVRFNPLKVAIKLPFPRKHVFNGQHYWEVGKIGFSVRKISSHINKAGFEIVKQFHVFENPDHLFFVLQKI